MPDLDQVHASRIERCPGSALVPDRPGGVGVGSFVDLVSASLT